MYLKGAVILKTCCFTVLLLMLSSFFVVELTNSELYRNIYSIIVVIFIVIIDIYFLKKATAGKGFQSKKMTVIILILLALIFVALFLQFPKPVNINVFGNNITAGYYENGIGSKGQYSIEEIISEKEEAVGMTELYRNQSGEYITAFYYNSHQVAAYDIHEEAGKYYFVGERHTIYSGDMASDEYSEEETIKADIVRSFDRANTLKWDNNLPAWGITRINNIKELRINGKKVDVIKTIKGQDNKEFYFWYVKDMGKKDLLEEIIISYEE